MINFGTGKAENFIVNLDLTRNEMDQKIPTIYEPLVWFATTLFTLSFALFTMSGRIVGLRHFGFSSSSGSNAYSNLGISEDPEM